MKSKAILVLAGLVALVILGAVRVPTAHAQAVYGGILGTVTDPQGAAVANAKVTVIDEGKNNSDTTTTNESGNYAVGHLIAGSYTVRVEAPGFKVSEQKGVLVSVDANARVDLQFQVGGTSETVEVTGEAPQLKTDRADVAVQFNEKYVEDLPILNRNFTQIQLLSPGSQKLVGWSHAATENPQGGQQIFSQGQHFSGTGFELDGSDNQDPILGIIVVNPNLDAVTEAKVALQNYDAEFGKAVASLVTAVTKSGSNQIHGSGFYFLRSDGFQARDPFTQSTRNSITNRFIPQAKWQQFGGTIGGPIIKDKLFFFGSGSVLDIPGSRLATRTYFADAAKQGIFTYGNGAQANLFNIYAAYNAAKGTTFPASLSQMNAMTQARLAEVDRYRQNAGGLSAPEVQPTDPNLRQWEWQVPNSRRTYYPTFRVDYNPSNRWRVNAAYNQTKENRPYQYADHWPGDGRGAAQHSNNMSLAFGLETILSPNLLNQVKGGYLYTYADFGVGGSDGFYTNPTINYGYGGYTDNYEMPNSRKQPVFSVSDTMTWLKGSHTLGFGFNAYREVNQYWDPPEGFTIIDLGLDVSDPARDVLTKELAARELHADRAAQSRRQLHRHPVSRAEGSGELCGAGQPRRRGATRPGSAPPSARGSPRGAVPGSRGARSRRRSGASPPRPRGPPGALRPQRGPDQAASSPC